MRVAIQGFGNAGQHIARLLAADGHAIVAVSDSNGAVKADGGLDLERLVAAKDGGGRSEEHTSELQSLMRISYAVFCLKKKNKKRQRQMNSAQREIYSTI